LRVYCAVPANIVVVAMVRLAIATYRKYSNVRYECRVGGCSR
jgi:hypothetical protein